LKANASCADNIDILYYVRYGDDFEVAAPITSAPPNPPFVFPAADAIAMASEGESDIIGNQIVPSLKTKYAEIGVGEYVGTIKRILSRYNALSTLISPTFTGVSINPYFFAAATMVTSSGVIQSPTYGGDALSYLGLMYAGFRGSIKVGVVNEAAESNWEISLANINNDNGWISSAKSFFGPVNWSTPGTGNPLNIGRTGIRGSSVYVKIPYYVDTLYTLVQPNITDSVVHPSNLGDGPLVWANLFSGTSDIVMILRSVSDDFVLSNFVCTPLVMTSYI